MNGRYCNACGEMDYSEWGDMPCACGRGPEQPQPSADEECDGRGHPYYGDDGEMGRCWCGSQTYPVGGPA